MGRTLSIETPEVFLPFTQKSRYKGAFGGRGGMKSHQFAGMVVEECLAEPGTKVVCIREIQKSLEHSVKSLVEDKIRSWGVEKQFRILTTHIETPGEGVIIFNGMQNHTADSIKSLNGFRIAWIEEAQSLSQRSLDLLRPTIFRIPNSEIWASWNPRFPTDPIDALLRGKDVPPDAIVIRSSFEDNPWFPPGLQREMEYDRRVDNEKYLHVWEGGYETHSQSRVFKNWKVEEFETPKDAVFLFGGDWGYSIDPNVLVRMWLGPDPGPGAHRKLYIDQEVYMVGCEIDWTPALFDTLANEKSPTWPLDQKPGMARNWPIIADSARPETISYLQRHGYSRLEAAKKGPDSVKEGIIFIQGFEIIIHPRCRHTKDEFTHYNYVVDKLTGLVTNVLEDKKNHVIDSVRYALEKLRGGNMRVRQALWGG
jgi:phage terminase large subunit